jgi:hypothetical protein
MIFKIPDKGEGAGEGDAGWTKRPTGAFRSAASRAISTYSSRHRRRARRPHRRHHQHREAKGITIYPIQSPVLQRFDEQPERWIDVRWDLDEANKSRFMARIMINALNEPGTLAKLAQTIGRCRCQHPHAQHRQVATDFHRDGLGCRSLGSAPAGTERCIPMQNCPRQHAFGSDDKLFRLDRTDLKNCAAVIYDDEVKAKVMKGVTTQ